jgi:CubicO group peptidase (beta-lactamase class C family)
VFDPLAMPRTYFAAPPPAATARARGHTPFDRALMPFLLVFAPAFLVLLGLGLGAVRLQRGRWQGSRTAVWAAFAVASGGTFWFLASRAGSGVLAAYFTLCGLLGLGAWLGLAWAGGRLLARRLRDRRWAGRLATAASLVLLLAAVRGRPATLPDWIEPGGNAASSLHATAGDLARFLVELCAARHLEAPLLEEMRTPQVALGGDDAWGLGVGIQQSGNGPSLWHWGSNPGVRAMMVVYPQQGLGVVVLANSGEAGDLVRAVVARALGGKTDWDG